MNDLCAEIYKVRYLRLLYALDSIIVLGLYPADNTVY